MPERRSTVTTEAVAAANPANVVSGAAKANAIGLLLAAAGMALQIAGGSTLYPSLAGPIVLLVVALIVLLKPGRWTPFLALLVPLVLGVGAIGAALMTGTFIDQLTDTARMGVLLGSLMHVAGLALAVVAGFRMAMDSRRA
jgi:hypothetical protein